MSRRALDPLPLRKASLPGRLGARGSGMAGWGHIAWWRGRGVAALSRCGVKGEASPSLCAPTGPQSEGFRALPSPS